MSNKKEIDEMYSSLYDSLGVEPGLLSKTPIGRKLNSKYRDDSIDAKIYAKKYLDNMTEKDKNENDVKIENISPFIGHTNMPEDIIEKENQDIESLECRKPCSVIIHDNTENEYLSVATIDTNTGLTYAAINSDDLMEPLLEGYLDDYMNRKKITKSELIDELQVYIAKLINEDIQNKYGKEE